MNIRQFLISALTVPAFLLASCATAPQNEDGIITAVQTADGSFIAVDEDGNDVSDAPESALLLALVDALNAPELTDEEIWSVDSQGNLTHIQSGGICPIEWGEFTLAKPSIFNRNGMNVGCNYQSALLQASFTFYMYVNQQDVDDELDEVLNTIKMRSPTAKEVDLHMIGPPPFYYSGRGLETEIDGGEIKRDAILAANEAGWRIKLRMTYLATDAQEMEHLGAIMLRGKMDRVGRDSIGSLPTEESESPELDT